MQTVKLSNDFQVEIPRRVRDRVDFEPGQEFKVHLHGDHILLVPIRKDDSLREQVGNRTSVLAAVN